MKTVVIIGGGAAGMMAAATIGEVEARVSAGSCDVEIVLLEKGNRLGKKVLLTGGGRCNVTTGLTDVREVLTKYPRGGKFLRDAMYNFSPPMMMEWVSAHGVPLKTEKDLRVFPVSDRSSDIVGIFEKVLSESGVKIVFGVEDVRVGKGRGGKGHVGFEVGFGGDRVVHADKVIVATGSSAEGYEIARSLGHSVTKLAPSLCGLSVGDRWVKSLAGLSFKDVKLKLVCGAEKKLASLATPAVSGGGSVFEFRGPFLFSHKGVTGPACFALSALSAYEEIGEHDLAKLRLDFFPDLSYEELLIEIAREVAKNPKKFLQNTLGLFMPKSFVTEVLGWIGVDGSKKNSCIAKRELNKVIEAFKNLSISIVGRAGGEEFVTAGGIDLKEVNPKTMESKICSGLYFAGEILDIDGFTGGFNLQAAWATGRRAGERVLS